MYMSQNISAKKISKYNALIDGESMQEKTTYLTHY